MFDANMRYLPKGLYFFTKVWDVREGSILWKRGVRTGDLIRCKMRDRTHRNPRVKMFLPTGTITVRSNDDGICAHWLVYEGRTDGRGFIDSRSHLKCKEIMEARGLPFRWRPYEDRI
jgi:hypothetical protein